MQEIPQIRIPAWWAAMASQDSWAAEPPLSTHALPDLTHRPKASAVTLGRAS